MLPLLSVLQRHRIAKERSITCLSYSNEYLDDSIFFFFISFP